MIVKWVESRPFGGAGRNDLDLRTGLSWFLLPRALDSIVIVTLQSSIQFNYHHKKVEIINHLIILEFEASSTMTQPSGIDR